MKLSHREPYKPLRAKNYMRTGDQLDVMYKLAEALQAQGIVLPAEVTAWMADCQAVKDKFPKN